MGNAMIMMIPTLSVPMYILYEMIHSCMNPVFFQRSTNYKLTTQLLSTIIIIMTALSFPIVSIYTVNEQESTSVSPPSNHLNASTRETSLYYISYVFLV